MDSADDALEAAFEEQQRAVETARATVERAAAQLQAAKAALHEVEVLQERLVNEALERAMAASGRKRSHDELSDAGADDGPDRSGTLGVAPQPAPAEPALDWFGKLLRVVREAQGGSRVRFFNRDWSEKYTLAHALPNDAIDLPTLLPLQLATILAHGASTQDAKALRATSVPPPGLSHAHHARWLLRSIDEREVFTGMRNMFMQSGIPCALQLGMIALPTKGLCVWLMCALVSARYAARLAHQEEPRSLNSREVVHELRQLAGSLEHDECLSQTISKLESVAECEWDQIDGDPIHYGQVQEASEALARQLHVHIPIFTLARHDDRDGFAIACSFIGDPAAPNAFGPCAGALVTYEGGPSLSHVDVLVPP